MVALDDYVDLGPNRNIGSNVVDVDLNKGPSNMLEGMDRLIDGDSSFGTDRLTNAAKIGGIGLLTYAAAGAAPRMIKSTGIPDAYFNEGRFSSNVIKDFYSKGSNKLALTLRHFGYNPSQWAPTGGHNYAEDASVRKDISRFISDYNNDVKYQETGTGRHRGGFAKSAMEEMDTFLPKKAKIGKLTKDKITGLTYRAYNQALDHKDPKLINAIDDAIRSGKTPWQSASELNFENDLRWQEDKLNRGEQPYRLGKYRHTLMSEKAKNTLIPYVTGHEVTPKQWTNLHEAGYSKPVRTTAEKFFQGRANAWPGLKAHDNISVSELGVGKHGHGEKVKLIKATKKSPIFQIGEAVARRADLTDVKDIKRVAADFSSHLRKNPSLMMPYKLHPSSDGWEKELNRFLKSYKVTDKGDLLINFSNDYKPNELLGGTNANIKFSRGKGKQSVNLDGNRVKLPGKGKLYTEVFITDQYDMMGSGLQQKKHINFVYSNNNIKEKEQFMKNALKTNVPNREKLMTAIEQNDIEGIRKYSKRVGEKTLKKIAYRMGSGNPITQLFSKVVPKIARATTLGKVASVGLTALSSKDLLDRYNELSK